MKLLNSGTEDVRRSASWAITMAATDEPTAVEIGRYGYVDIMGATTHLSKQCNS